MLWLGSEGGGGLFRRERTPPPADITVTKILHPHLALVFAVAWAVIVLALIAQLGYAGGEQIRLLTSREVMPIYCWLVFWLIHPTSCPRYLLWPPYSHTIRFAISVTRSANCAGSKSPMESRGITAAASIMAGCRSHPSSLSRIHRFIWSVSATLRS